MASSITIPTREQLGNYPPAIADQLIAMATAAQNDINALQGGGVTGTAPVHLVRAASTANIASLAAASTTMDGVTLVAGNRVLLKNQSTGSQNGIYIVGTVGGGTAPLTRDADMNVSGEAQSGMLVAVSEGTVNADVIYMLTTNNPITLGTTALTFGVAAAAIVAGTGLAFTGSTLNGQLVTTTTAGLVPPNGAGTALGDSSPTIAVGGGRWYTLPAATLSANRTVTLGTTGAVAGDTIEITRLDATANTLAIVNGGGGAGTLVTLPASKTGFARAQYDGTNWALRAMGTV